MPTNQLVANRMFTLSAEGVCGVSVMAVSFALSAPAGDNERQGGYVVMVTNNAGVAPLHVQPRVVWTDAAGTSATALHVNEVFSNPNAFGGSALLAKSLHLVLSGEAAAIPLRMVAGSALQIWIMTASTTASAVIISGAAALWRI